MKICPGCKYIRTDADDKMQGLHKCPKCGRLYSENVGNEEKTPFNQHPESKIILCPGCGQKLRIPVTDSVLSLKCPECKTLFPYSPQRPENPPKKPLIPPRKPPSQNTRKLFVPIIVLALVGFVFFLIITGNRSGQVTSAENIKNPQHQQWVRIAYDNLIDKSIITHSGETVGQVIQKIKTQPNLYKGLLQPYLEPYSSLCHDKVLEVAETNTQPFVNILTHYPVGSEQPAWAALFREGHFQLYYNRHRIRLFIKGKDINNSFAQHLSVIRHPIRDVVSSENINIEKLEVYVFNNSYAERRINLNLIPAVYPIEKVNLSSKRKSLDLDSIAALLNHNVVLEAIEVSRDNDLFFYGRKSGGQSIAGHPVSISDIAVVYRSVFHYGYNAPYISLDPHEDNRYAKVNFGGHLQNTRTGNVVLEADKLFKTLSTGLDPNTRKSVLSEITKAVPDFLTEDERSVLTEDAERRQQIRYWFYPDKIGTVTDGSIAVVDSPQFLADAERMDTPVALSSAVRETIDHLNRNYVQYKNADRTFQELSTAGRIMALVIWLREMNMNKRVDLDALLSVRIPAYTTPEKTKKMMAVTAGFYHDGMRLSRNNIRNHTKTYNISHLLDAYPAQTSDERFLEIANEYFSNLDISHELYPPQYRRLKSELINYEKRIDSVNSAIDSLEKEIEKGRENLNRYSAADVNHFNLLVEQYNRKVNEGRMLLDVYNDKVNEINRMNIQTRGISSIGGGISLEPDSFKKPVVDRQAEEIREISKIKAQLTHSGDVSISGDWVRNNPGSGQARINPLPYIAELD